MRTIQLMFVYSVHPYSVSSCAPGSAENWALRAAVTLSSSQWLENHKRGQWALSCLQVKMSLHWLVPGEVYRAICKLPLTLSCSGRLIRTVCIWKCTWVCNNWLFMQQLQSHSHPCCRASHPSPSASRQTLCRSLQLLNKRITLRPPKMAILADQCMLNFFNHNHVSQTVIILWLHLQDVD